MKIKKEVNMGKTVKKRKIQGMSSAEDIFGYFDDDRTIAALDEARKEQKKIDEFCKIKETVLPDYRKMEFKDDRFKIPKPTIRNYIIYLDRSIPYGGRLKYNEYLRRDEIDGRPLTDNDINKIYADIEIFFGYVVRQNADTAIDCVLQARKYNPLINTLESIKWDGKKRIERIFIDLLDADDTELTRELTKKWMIAAVKRTLHPGCKFDNMIVLQGGQGIGKSTICEKLSMGFCNTVSLGEIGNKDLIDKLNKTWIAIIDEMDTFNKREMSTVKTFLSQTMDTVRLPYRKNSDTFSRHCIFIGSTNDDTFLRDNTSSVERRFWVIKCNKTTRDDKVYKLMTEDYVRQLWGEAYYYYISDPEQYLDVDAELMEKFAKEQEQFKTYNDDDYIESIKYVLDSYYPIKENGELTDIDQLRDYGDGPKYKINKVPAFILKKYMKEEYRDDRSNKTIENALKGEWIYKDARYKYLDNRILKSWVRVNPVSEKKEYDPLDAFKK